MNDVEVTHAFGLTATPKRGRVRYEIHDHATISAPENQSGLLDIWSPVIPETPYQRVLDIDVDAPGPWQILREPEFGNPIFHLRIALPGRAAIEVRFDYVVERMPVVHDLDPQPVSPIATSALFSRCLAEERYVDVNDNTRALARDIVGGETKPVLQARRLYDHVTAMMAYDAAHQSWKGSTEHALVCSVGNCNDIRALFISLARSLGIPARLILGKPSSHHRREKKPANCAVIIAGRSFSRRAWAGSRSMHHAPENTVSTRCSAHSKAITSPGRPAATSC